MSPSVLKSRGASRPDIVGRLVGAGGCRALASASCASFSRYRIIQGRAPIITSGLYRKRPVFSQERLILCSFRASLCASHKTSKNINLSIL
jgi:hypothetical protein